MVCHQDSLSSERTIIRVVSHQDSLSSGQFVIRMVCHQDGLSSGLSAIRMAYHQDSWSSGWPIIRVVCHQDSLSSEWSVIRIVSHQDSLSSEWSVIRMAYHQGGLSSGWSQCHLYAPQWLAGPPITRGVRLKAHDAPPPPTQPSPLSQTPFPGSHHLLYFTSNLSLRQRQKESYSRRSLLSHKNPISLRRLQPGKSPPCLNSSANAQKRGVENTRTPDAY